MWQVFIGGVWGGAGKVKQKIWTRMYPGSKVTLMAESRFDLRMSKVYIYFHTLSNHKHIEIDVCKQAHV